MKRSQTLERIRNVSDYCISAVGSLLMVCISIIVALEVIARFFLHPFSWAEEVTQFCLVSVVFVGAGIVESKSEHVKVDYLLLKLPKKVMLLLNILSRLFLLVILGYFLRGQQLLYPYVSKLRSPAGDIPLVWVYYVVAIGVVWWGVCLISSIGRIIGHLRTKAISTKNQDSRVG